MSYGGPCVYCGDAVEAENAAYRVAGLEFTRDQGGANVIHDRQRVPDWIAHKSCAEEALRKKQRGIAVEQESLL